MQSNLEVLCKSHPFHGNSHTMPVSTDTQAFLQTESTFNTMWVTLTQLLSSQHCSTPQQGNPVQLTYQVPYALRSHRRYRYKSIYKAFTLSSENRQTCLTMCSYGMVFHMTSPFKGGGHQKASSVALARNLFMLQ